MRSERRAAIVEAKSVWKDRVLEIASTRTWDELIAHFNKHLTEMKELDLSTEDAAERAINKAFSLLDLCAFAIEKTGVEISFGTINYPKLLERIDVHEKYLEEQDRLESEQKMREMEEDVERILKETDSD